MSAGSSVSDDDRGLHPQSPAVPHFPHLTKNVVSQLARLGGNSSSSISYPNGTSGSGGHFHDLSTSLLPPADGYSSSSVDSSSTLVSESTLTPSSRSRPTSDMSAAASLSSSLYYVDCTSGPQSSGPISASSSHSSNRSSICSNSTLTQSSIGSYHATDATDVEMDPDPLPPPPPELRIGDTERLDFPPPPPTHPLSSPPPPPLKLVHGPPATYHQVVTTLRRNQFAAAGVNGADGGSGIVKMYDTLKLYNDSLPGHQQPSQPANQTINMGDRVHYSTPMSSFGSLPRRPAPPPPIRSTAVSGHSSASPSPSSSSGVSDVGTSSTNSSASSAIAAAASTASAHSLSSASFSCASSCNSSSGYEATSTLMAQPGRLTSNAGGDRGFISPDYEHPLVQDEPPGLPLPPDPHRTLGAASSHYQHPNNRETPSLVSFKPQKSISPTYGWVYQDPRQIPTSSSADVLATHPSRQLDSFQTMDRNNNGPGPSCSSTSGPFNLPPPPEPDSDDDNRIKAKSYTLFLDDPPEPNSKECIEMMAPSGSGSISPSDEMLVGGKRPSRCTSCINCTRIVVCTLAVLLFCAMLSIIGFTLINRSSTGGDDGLAFWKQFFPIKHEKMIGNGSGENCTTTLAPPPGVVDPEIWNLTTTLKPIDPTFLTTTTPPSSIPIGNGDGTTTTEVSPTISTVTEQQMTTAVPESNRTTTVTITTTTTPTPTSTSSSVDPLLNHTEVSTSTAMSTSTVSTSSPESPTVHPSLAPVTITSTTTTTTVKPEMIITTQPTMAINSTTSEATTMNHPVTSSTTTISPSTSSSLENNQTTPSPSPIMPIIVTSTITSSTTTPAPPSSTTVTDILDNSFIVNHTTAKPMAAANMSEVVVGDSREGKLLKEVTVAPAGEAEMNQNVTTTTPPPLQNTTTTTQNLNVELPMQVEPMSLESVTISLTPNQTSSIPNVTKEEEEESVTSQLSNTVTPSPKGAPSVNSTKVPEALAIPEAEFSLNLTNSSSTFAYTSDLVPESIQELSEVLLSSIPTEAIPEAKSILESTTIVVPLSEAEVPVTKSPPQIANITTTPPSSTLAPVNSTSVSKGFFKKISEGFGKIKSNISARFRKPTSRTTTTTTTEASAIPERNVEPRIGTLSAKKEADEEYIPEMTEKVLQFVG